MEGFNVGAIVPPAPWTPALPPRPYRPRSTLFFVARRFCTALSCAINLALCSKHTGALSRGHSAHFTRAVFLFIPDARARVPVTCFHGSFLVLAFRTNHHFS